MRVRPLKLMSVTLTMALLLQLVTLPLLVMVVTVLIVVTVVLMTLLVTNPAGAIDPQALLQVSSAITYA